MENSKIHDAAAKQNPISGNLRDAMEMLSAIYFRILRINLTTDTYETLQDNVNDMDVYPGQYPTMSSRLAAYAERGYIHGEDEAEYLHFCSLENLRREMEENHYISFRYRRVVKGEYHWVSAEVVRSSDYRPDNQAAVLYVRDINEEYLHQLDQVMHHTVGSVGIVTLRVTSGVVAAAVGRLEKLELAVPNEDMDEYIRRVSASIPRPKARERFISLFSRESLLKSWEAGRRTLCQDHAVYCERTQQYRMYHTTAEMIENSFTREIECVLYFNDVTSSFLAEKIPRLVYQRKYESVAIIDVNKNIICPEPSSDMPDTEDWEKRENYTDYVRRLGEETAPPEEREMFFRKMSLDGIRRELETQERYSMTVHQLDGQGSRLLKRFSFLYLQKELGMILCVVDDITELYGKDVLTGGYNRQGFVREAELFLTHCADRTDYALLYFNIKNFKAVNELFGVETGDVVLKSIYERLENSAIAPLITARVEADHFLCLTEFGKLTHQALVELCDRKFTQNGKTLHLFGRCGIFRIEEQPMSITGMIDRAKLAKRYISDEYVQPYKIYDRSMRIAYVDQAEVLGELAEGIANEQFQVYYQPVVNPATGRVISAEALVRWKHPEKGMISPALFIPALEENGHISELDFYVIRKVRKFLSERYREGKPIVPVSMNLSWMDFYDEELMEWILKQQEEEGEMPKDAGRYEITETSYAALDEDRTRILESIRTEGSKILLDDFGSGYSSFGMIQNYDFDILKIDMSFVRRIGTNPKTRSILACMIDMAHKVGIKLVAEGAETKEQAEFLREQGCDYIQGYYYYRPMPQEDFIRVLETQGDGNGQRPETEKNI